MIPSNRNNPQASPHNALSVDRHITVYVLLAGMAGGLMLAFVVVVCCKVCLKKKKTFARESKEYDPEAAIKGENSLQWPEQALPDSVTDGGTDIELQEIPKGRQIGGAPTTHAKCPLESRNSSPERPPEVTSAVRRRSSVGIQRQASVCLSDDEDNEELGAIAKKPCGPQKQVTKVSAIVHHGGNDKLIAHSWEQKLKGPAKPHQTTSIWHPPFIHSHSSPDSRTTATTLELKQGRHHSTFSLRGIAAENLARVVDLEDYHYSRHQVWELAAQGATLLEERSQSSLDVADADGWEELPSRIQQATSTETGFLEKKLEEHQLENLRTLLRRYSPVYEEDNKSWCKVRYNDTGSKEDIRDEVIEIISGESDDSNSSIDNEITKQQYRKIWELRATLEEEEEEEGDITDPQEVSEGYGIREIPLAEPEETDQIFSQGCSFESSDDVAGEDAGDDCPEGCEYLQLPLHELRRHCYKSLLSKRLQKRTPSDHLRTSGGAESSFESVDSSSTDRTEGGTTSFESTTDNTDSAGENQTNRLQQMKADSGYKSMESNGKAPRLCRKQLQFVFDTDSVDAVLNPEGSMEQEQSFEVTESFEKEAKELTELKDRPGTSKQTVIERGMSSADIPIIIETLSGKKRSRNILKKHHTEGDIQISEQKTFPEVSSEPRKVSVFQRIFRSGRLRVDQIQLYRDYSIDEKSDALFREFSRPDISEGEFHRNWSGRLHGHVRLHHRSLPSTDSGSPRMARKVLSPQLSIEEESCESGGEEHHYESEEQFNLQHAGEVLQSPRETQAQIPVIYLSQGRGDRPN